MVVINNTKENEALVKFRAQVEDLFENPEDHFLIRWLRARNFDIKKAEEMLRNYVEWKKNNAELHHVKSWKPAKAVDENLKYKFIGLDYEGRPVLWLPIGRWEVRRLLSEGLKADCIRYQYKILEEIANAIETQRKRCGVNQFVAFADSAELSFWKLANYETIEVILRFFKEFESYFPELLHSCYIVNNPRVFSYIFNLVKPLLSTHTLSKVQLFDCNQSKWEAVLQKAIPDKYLPVEYGGTAPPILSDFCI